MTIIEKLENINKKRERREIFYNLITQEKNHFLVNLYCFYFKYIT